MRFGKLLTCETKDIAEVGKKYVFGDNYKIMKSIQHGDEKYENIWFVKLSTLGYVSDSSFPFNSTESTPIGNMFQFALEVLEDELKYRPYKSCDEMKEDYKQRFNVRCGDNPPFIWVADKEYKAEELIIVFGDSTVRTGIEIYSLEDIFEKTEYLDHTPCGKRIDA